MNELKRKLLAGQRIHGTLVCLTDPALCEIMGRVGYDCVWIDTEHTYMSFRDVLCHLSTARSANLHTLVRVPQHDLTFTKKILEMGPDGIIFPMARSAEEITELMQMTLYPPRGNRGFGPMRAIGYGAVDAKDYAEREVDDLCRFVQIEHVDLIEDLERVASLPYVDGFIFGPNDLSGSLGEFLNVFGDKTLSAIRRAVEVLRKHGKLVGLAGGMSEHDIGVWSSLGLDLLFAGGDWNFLYAHGKNTLDLMKRYF